MTFTYDPTADSGNDYLITQIRLKVGDFIENSGPRRDGSNFSDEELQLAYKAEGSHWQRAAANILEILGAEWSVLTGSEALDVIQSSSQQAYAFRNLAKDLRKMYGFGSDSILNLNTKDSFQVKLNK